MVKSSGVSTGELNAFLRLHLRPINLVVYQGPSGPKTTESLSWGGLPA